MPTYGHNTEKLLICLDPRARLGMHAAIAHENNVAQGQNT